MYHRYKKLPIPSGERFVIETCVNCPARQKKYKRVDKNGHNVLNPIDESGKIIRNIIPCIKIQKQGKVINMQPPIIPIEQKTIYEILSLLRLILDELHIKKSV